MPVDEHGDLTLNTNDKIFPRAPFFFKVLMWTAMKKIFVDKNNQEDAVRSSGLDYCIVRPGGLTVDAPTGRFGLYVHTLVKGNSSVSILALILHICPFSNPPLARTGVINVIDGEAGSITRADVASFCLDSVTMDDFPYIGKAPCISSVGGTSCE